MSVYNVGGIKLVEANKIEPRIWRMNSWPASLFNIGDRVTSDVEMDGGRSCYEKISFRVRDREFKEYNDLWGLTLYIEVVGD